MPDTQPDGRTPAQRRTDHASLVKLSETLVPALVEKLASSGLGELEVREGAWRIRLRRPIAVAPPARRADRPRLTTHAEREGHGTREAQRSGPAVGPGFAADGVGTPVAGLAALRRAAATSPAVGVFRPGPAIGTRVRAGDPVGSVDLLGIPQDVPAPIDGTLIELFPSAGEAVEYGEPIATVEADAGQEASGGAARPVAPNGADAVAPADTTSTRAADSPSTRAGDTPSTPAGDAELTAGDTTSTPAGDAKLTAGDSPPTPAGDATLTGDADQGADA
jgi:biotin carboxyl carrier protein